MMNRRSWIIVVGVLTAGIWVLAQAQTPTPPPGERPNIGSVERVQKHAEAVYGARARQLSFESPLFFMDLLRTGPDARLEAGLADGSMIRMGENAELAVDEFVYGLDDTEETTLRLVKGALLYVSDKLRGNRERKVRVRTPVAILGVRGTEFWVGPIDGATGVLVIAGEVSVGTTMGVVNLGPGEGTMVQDNGTLSPRKAWGQAKVARALAMVAFD
jgi:hypothetical protein